MPKWIRIYSTSALEWWARFIGHHPRLTILFSFLAAVTVLIYAINHFTIDTDLNNMISDKLPYRRLEKEFQQAFPQLGDTILIVVDAKTPEAARHQTKRVADRLEKESGLFKAVYIPGGGRFFEENGLLYLSMDELEDLADGLANVQPFLGFISNDFSLRGLFSVIKQIVGAEVEEKGRLVPVLDQVSKAFEGATSNAPYPLSWQELMIGEKAAREMSRQFIIAEPLLTEKGLFAGERAIQAIRGITKELELDGTNGVRVRLTGDVVLAYEDLLTVRRGIGFETLLSFILVSLALVIGLRSGRLVLASLLTLLVGLTWTLGFAMALVGHLNLISVTFGVLFIGLGIDYSIQYCLRYRELIALGIDHPEAIVGTGMRLGKSLLLCTITTAIGFYSFLPTAYTGVSELGLISGTGMFINFFATLTVLPALLTLMPLKRGKIKIFEPHKALYLLPYKHARAIGVGAIAVCISAVFFLPKVHFDYNPLNLYDPGSEAVSTIKELFQDENTPPWTLSVIAENEGRAKEMAIKLGRVKEVRQAITLASFVPENQAEKLNIISEIAVFMPPRLRSLEPVRLSYEEKMKSLSNLEKALKHERLGSREEQDAYWMSIRRLRKTVEEFKTMFANPDKGRKAVENLEKVLLSNLPFLYDGIETSLRAHPFTDSNLPEELRSRYVTSDGRYRVEVFPKENILNIDALERFVGAVTAVAPSAINTAVAIREAGRAVVQSFTQAIFYAIIAIVIFLLIDLKSIWDTLLILLPLGLSLLLTGGISAALDIPFNFANVIVVPLLLGFGVDTGIYFVYRFKTEPPPSGNMLETSTARALFFSTLTTILSFGTLSFSTHRGIASMGKLLIICIGFLMISTLLVLPGLLGFLQKSRGRNS